MKRYTKISNMSGIGKLKKELDTMLSKKLQYEREYICEVHNRTCRRLGASHILNKQTYPKLRYVESNIIISGWFCSHYYSHQHPDDPRALDHKNAIVRIHGENYREELLKIQVIQPKHNTHYLECLYYYFKQTLKKYGL